MQKSIIIKKHGGPEVLELEKIKLDSPGPNEIRVKNLILLINSKNRKIKIEKKTKIEHNFFYKAHPILRNIANKKLI